MPSPNIKDSPSERPSVTLVQLNRSLEKEQNRSNNMFQKHLSSSSSSSCLMAVVVVVCSLTSIQEARGKRSNHLLVSLSAIAQDKNKRQSKHSFVTAHNETTASVSHHNIPLSLKKTITLSFSFSYSHLTKL